MLEPELKGDATEHERKQHDQDWEVDRGDDDGEGERECCEQAEAAEYQPRLIAVPDRYDRTHDDGLSRLARREAVEQADAKIEAVEDDVIEDRQREQCSPQRYKVEDHRIPPIMTPAPRARHPRTAGLGGRFLPTPAGSPAAAAQGARGRP